MKIGIVNDMPLAVDALRGALATRRDFEVIWVATDGAQAVDYCTAQKPDVVLMDLVMPHMDGTQATRRIMRETPCAILIPILVAVPVPPPFAVLISTIVTVAILALPLTVIAILRLSSHARYDCDSKH